MVFLVVKNNSTPTPLPSEGSRATQKKLKIDITKKLQYKHIVGVKIYKSSMFIYVIGEYFFVF